MIPLLKDCGCCGTCIHRNIVVDEYGEEDEESEVLCTIDNDFSRRRCGGHMCPIIGSEYPKNMLCLRCQNYVRDPNADDDEHLSWDGVP
jgi:hypothetical protein